MPEVDPSKALSFETPQHLCDWLEKNHSTETELWVKVFKKKAKTPSITWDHLVVESLCWGWIDGVKKSLDDQAYLQRITPRKARSAWSKRNTEHVERLIDENRMREPGLVQVRAAKADGRWDEAYRVSEMQVPEDFLAALDQQPAVRQFFETLNKSNRYVIAYALASAKKPETRQRRFTKYLQMLVNGEKPK
ncbi:MAG: YdeI/OmpD-associated family protein [Cellvibrionaceae bacterium]